jgi:hypothetical protein
MLVPLRAILGAAFSATQSSYGDVLRKTGLAHDTVAKMVSGDGYPSSNFDSIARLINFVQRRGVRFTSPASFEMSLPAGEYGRAPHPSEHHVSA